MTTTEMQKGSGISMPTDEELRTADPRAGGEMLIAMRENFPGKRMSEIADMLDWSRVPKVKSSTIVQETRSVYMATLIRQAGEGNQHAASLLEYHKRTGSFNGAPQEPADG